MLARALKTSSVVAFALFVAFYFKNRRYDMTGLAPKSGNLAKVATANALVFTQTLRSPAPAAELEDWHDQPSSDDRLSSEFWSENLYFWANTRPGSAGEFLYTLRMSFVGPNATSPISWWTFQLNGEEWSLPKEFDAKSVERTRLGGPREVVAPSLGRLVFTLDKPLEQWTLTYDGVVENAATGKRMHCNSTFVVHLNPNSVYHFSTMQDPLAIARSMSRRPWSRDYFESLRSQRQVRYTSLAREVKGVLELSPKAGDAPVVSLPTNWLGDGSRDHAWGVRKWNYLWRYIWFPPIRFSEPLMVEGLQLAYLTGTFVEFGTLENAVIGALLDMDGKSLTWSGATSIANIAPKWYQPAVGQTNESWGETTIPGKLRFTIGFGDAAYMLDISVERGTQFGLWSHAFLFSDDSFEVHEAQSRWTFLLRKAGDQSILQQTKAIGLLEFGSNLGDGFVSSDI